MGWSRRAILGGLAAPLLAGCSSDSNSDTNMFVRMAGQSLDVFGGGQSITFDQVASIPYATIGIRAGDGPQALLVLATRTGDTLLWTSAAHIAIETQAGRITRTSGLPHDLSATSIVGTDPLQAGLQHLQGEATASRYADFADRNAYQNLVLSSVATTGVEEIEILGTRLKTLHAVERGSCAALGWEFTNEYWADIRSGFIWRSSQRVHPDLFAVELEVFRPPAT
jgi:hypothetical protein